MIYKKTWKYILTKDDSNFCRRFNLYRVKSLKDFSDVHKGDIGGYIEGYHNLSRKGNCWVYDKALVGESAQVTDNAIVCDSAKVFGNAKVSGNAKVTDNAHVGGFDVICGSSRVDK